MVERLAITPSANETTPRRRALSAKAAEITAWFTPTMRERQGAAPLLSVLHVVSYAVGGRALVAAPENIGSCDAQFEAPQARALQHPRPPPDQDDKLLQIAACPDTSACPGDGATRTVFVYQGGKSDAAFGNLFYAMAANAVLYASHKGQVPLIQFERSRVYKTMGKNWSIANRSLWEIFYQPFCADVSRWVSACPNVVRAPDKPVSFYYPDIQQRWRWPVRQWYNMGSPAAKACERDGSCWRFNETLFRRWRRDGHAVSTRIHRLNRRYKCEVAEAWHQFNPNNTGPVLGLQMRGSDKRSARKKVYPCVFTPYVEDFFAHFETGLVYLATESATYTKHLQKVWGDRPWGHRVFYPKIQTRVRVKLGNFQLHDPMQVAHDVLIDIQMLARADYLLHGASAVAEAVIYTNPALHWMSTHLEYDNACTPKAGCLDAPWRWQYNQRKIMQSLHPNRREYAGAADSGSSPVPKHGLRRCDLAALEGDWLPLRHAKPVTGTG